MRFAIFHQKHVIFHELMISPWCVMNSIAYCCGICIDQLMLGIGEVWYFSSKTRYFSRIDDFTMVCDEHHCLLLWYLSSSPILREYRWVLKSYIRRVPIDPHVLFYGGTNRSSSPI